MIEWVSLSGATRTVPGLSPHPTDDVNLISGSLGPCSTQIIDRPQLRACILSGAKKSQLPEWQMM
ncbi:hypothetical protein GCM10018780_25900 [Streptomyces lanatus]|nr:hypothetical protein GCM10018780_25900 [Streptomyces lanatus]